MPPQYSLFFRRARCSTYYFFLFSFCQILSILDVTCKPWLGFPKDLDYREGYLGLIFRLSPFTCGGLVRLWWRWEPEEEEEGVIEMTEEETVVVRIESGLSVEKGRKDERGTGRAAVGRAELQRQNVAVRVPLKHRRRKHPQLALGLPVELLLLGLKLCLALLLSFPRLFRAYVCISEVAITSFTRSCLHIFAGKVAEMLRQDAMSGEVVRVEERSWSSPTMQHFYQPPPSSALWDQRSGLREAFYLTHKMKGEVEQEEKEEEGEKKVKEF
ncbi:hypothetical protein K435DRAFT_793976 [Dendrothele bispora CBS 962.96]|uniref:Uncharacterized protein n=1 Tax=Dendrothele bispora (strain CBS 962.96) TaxID=1314807 RepID=A0A4S8MEY1_DENBC|nr:hypothetical protein K435DRAFT_793976 [Dendrothele bispora CBS 962.96]